MKNSSRFLKKNNRKQSTNFDRMFNVIKLNYTISETSLRNIIIKSPIRRL